MYWAAGLQQPLSGLACGLDWLPMWLGCTAAPSCLWPGCNTNASASLVALDFLICRAFIESIICLGAQIQAQAHQRLCEVGGGGRSTAAVHVSRVRALGPQLCAVRGVLSACRCQGGAA